MPHKPLTATNLAEHQHRQCDLFIHKTYHNQPSTPPSGNGPRHGPPELVKAQYQRGMDWEGILFSWLRESDLLLRVPSIPLESEHLLENIQLDERRHFFISGLNFIPPQEDLNNIYEELGEIPVAFGLAKPDLLEITKTTNGIQWRVIDAKASKFVKTSHHIQIYFYTLCLQHLLKGSTYQCTGTAGVWLPPKTTSQRVVPDLNDIKSISISLLAPALDVLLFRQLPGLLTASEDRAAWLYNPTCQGCRFQQECKSRAQEEENLGMIPNLTMEQAQVLKDSLRITHMSTSSNAKLTDIEDLHYLLSNPNRMKMLARKSPSLLRKVKRTLSIPKGVIFDKGIFSPVVEAARIKQVQVVLRRNFTCTRIEDVAIVLSMIDDPARSSVGPIFFCISSFSAEIQLPQTVYCDGADLITKLSALLRMIENFQALYSRKYTVQVYVWSPQEQAALQSHIIHGALSSTAAPEDIRLCIGALAQGASLLQTSFQPILLSGPLLKFLSKASQKKEDYQACLKRLGLPTDGSIPVLRKRIDDEIERFQKEANDEDREQADRKYGQVPRIVALKREVERQLALPIPGSWDLAECHSILLPESPDRCPTEENIFAAYRKSKHEDYRKMLQERNRLVYDILAELRRRAIRPSTQSLLVNDASFLSTKFMDLCRQPQLRKLFYMQQFEVLTKLNELWRSRIEGCPDVPVVEYSHTIKGNRRCEHIFRLVSGAIDTPATDKSQSFYAHLLALDSADDDDSLPVEAMFDDLALSGLPFPLTTHTRKAWENQPDSVRQGLSIANVCNVIPDPDTGHTLVSLTTYGSLGLQASLHYRLSPRLVDFNTSKVLSALFEVDLRWESAADPNADEAMPQHHDIPFLQLILDPSSFGPAPRGTALLKTESDIQGMFRQLRDLEMSSTNAARLLVLKASQHRATQRIMSSRLSVIWGPPGTGKTYTVSLSLLRLIDALRRQRDMTPKIIFIAAVTHAAIEACRSKLVSLMNTYRCIKDVPIEWLDDVAVEVVTQASTHRLPDRQTTRPTVNIYAGTVYQLYNFSKRASMEVDVLVIDEAGQISLASTALVLRSLSKQGRIIIAGDSEQLAPILSAEYPKLSPSPLFGSVLDCLMAAPSAVAQVPSKTDMDNSMPQILSSQDTIVQLTENFRLNPDLGEFVSTIYSRQFKAQKFQAKQLAISLTSLDNHDSCEEEGFVEICDVGKEFLSALGHVMLRQPQLLLSPPEIDSKASSKEPQDAALTHRPVSLSLIRLSTWSSSTHRVEYEAHVRTEATLAAALVFWLRQCSPGDDIFVATPHRIQREAVKNTLRSLRLDVDRTDNSVGAGIPSSAARPSITVDTIERLQGSEAAFVICLFSLPRSASSDLGFLLERRRLNVAISRAKTMCILISSEEVLCPPVRVLADENVVKGYTFLKAYEKRAWSYDLSLDVDA